MKNNFSITVKEIKELILSQNLKNDDEIFIENGELYLSIKNN